MKLRDYIKLLQDIEQKHGDLETIYSKDDEGNYFSKVNYNPCVGLYYIGDGEFIPQAQFEDFEIEDEKDNINAVCIN